MNVFAQWNTMNPTERLLNVFTRPFGVDVVVERDCGWFDFKSYDFGIERSDSQFRDANVFVGPFRVVISHV